MCQPINKIYARTMKWKGSKNVHIASWVNKTDIFCENGGCQRDTQPEVKTDAGFLPPMSI